MWAIRVLELVWGLSAVRDVVGGALDDPAAEDLEDGHETRCGTLQGGREGVVDALRSERWDP